MGTKDLDPTEFAHAVADTVEAYRWEKRISSKRKLADAAGMTHTYLNARLGYAVPFDVADLARLAAVFKISVDDIFNAAIQRYHATPLDFQPAGFEDEDNFALAADDPGTSIEGEQDERHDT